MPDIHVHPEVASALKNGEPVVALESAVITAGLPREPFPVGSRLLASPCAGRHPELKDWRGDGLVNLELGRAMQRVVREGGAVPATIAVIKGDLCIGLNEDQLIALAGEPSSGKASVTNLAHVMAAGATAGTTVSATLVACGMARSNLHAAASGIRTFATGGIGGVHRDWQRLPDISADLQQIARTPACVVSSGAKSLLDLPSTLEILESLGVPVVGFRTNSFPQFFCAGDASMPLSMRIETPGEAAELCRVQWDVLQWRSGVMVANPVPEEFGMNTDEIESAVRIAEAAATERGISGALRTPFVLAELNRLTSGRSLEANISLLLNNARLAAEVAVALAQGTHSRSGRM